MIYDLCNEFDRERFKTRANALHSRRVTVELKERKPIRSGQQNRYLHVLLGYLAVEIGETLEYVKEQYFKRTCNRELFCQTVDDRLIGRVERMRSTSDLDSSEMTLAIERFRNWSAANGYYLPAPDEERFLAEAEKRIYENRQFI